MGLNKTVKTYSGHTYAERPESFVWRGKEYQVREIQKAWLEPGKRCFQVRTDNNESFRLCYNETYDRWWVVNLGGTD